MHPNPGLASCRSDSDQIGHPFVVKTRGQIIKERYQSTIHLIYQSFVNKLYHMAYILFLETLTESCQLSIIPVFDQELEIVINQMKKDPTIFKSRTIYELSSQQNLTRKYYIKVYRWLPLKQNIET